MGDGFFNIFQTFIDFIMRIIALFKGSDDTVK